MRARKKKNTIPRLERCSEYLTEQIVSETGRYFYIEIGCGKGKFITSLAESRPDDFFYAVEKVPDVLVMAAEKAKAKELTNLKFLLADADDLPELCPAGSIRGIYLNFSDPWPKKKGARKRLTYHTYLEKYRKILAPDGVIFMKTDNQGLFDFSLAEFRRYGYELFDVVRDLHASDVENCFTTEYEDRFTALGQPIFHLKARPVPGYEPPEDERPVAGTEDSERNIELDSVPER